MWLKARGLDDSSHRSCVLSRCASKITPPHSMFHKTLLGVPDTFSSFCSAPSETTPTTRPVTGSRSTLGATSLEGRQSGCLAEALPHTGHEPNTCIDVSSEHTPINYPSRRNSFNIENGLTTTVAASETFLTVFISKRQPAVAHNMYQQVK